MWATSLISPPGGPPYTCSAARIKLLLRFQPISPQRWSLQQSSCLVSRRQGWWIRRQSFPGLLLGNGYPNKIAATNTPQHIGVSECVGGTLCAMFYCSLVDSGLPPSLWDELVLTAAYLCNRVPHSAIQIKTPHKVVYGKDADLSHIKIFGVRAFVPIDDSTKLRYTSWDGIVCDFSKKRVTTIACGTPGSNVLLKLGTWSSSKHHHAWVQSLRSSLSCKEFSRRHRTSLKTSSMTTTF